MKAFPNDLNFKYPWRPYQARVLDKFHQYLHDNRLHIVAPPGSGKTVLGLEVVRRLRHPALILAPTLTIRNQWGMRLEQDFLDGCSVSWKSYRLDQPGMITLSTYQALHQAFKDDPDLVEKLKQAGIRTMVVDECHHLQKAWWKSLIGLQKQLLPQLIALTATPPFDVTSFEWNRYLELCGSIDEEIGVPELVKEGNLCPHQDYIFFTLPDQREQTIVDRFHQDLTDFYDYIRDTYWLQRQLKNHPYLTKPEEHLEVIFDEPAYFSSLMIVLEGVGGVVPASAVGIIGADESQLPEMDNEWLEIFLNGMLRQDPYFQNKKEEEGFKKIREHLSRMGAIRQGRVGLVEPPLLEKALRASTSKLLAIPEICKLEYESIGKELRMVILCDYILASLLPKDELDDPKLNRIGVAPVFEMVRRRFTVEVQLAVLTGSVVIIPSHEQETLRQELIVLNVPAEAIGFESLGYTSDYVEVKIRDHYRSKLVAAVTALFTKGKIQIIVGTKSLLGEGWDAPVINTLILATVVGSYVLSNQMRGRAIRSERNNSDKAANIWHLVCIDNYSENGGPDLAMLRRRFKAFHGPTFGTDIRIENGSDRFELPSLPFDPDRIAHLNGNMAIHAHARDRLRREWREGLEKGVHMIEEVRVPIAKTRRFQRIQKVLYQQTEQLLQKELRSFFYYSEGSILLTGLVLAFFWITDWWQPALSRTLFALLILFLIVGWKELRKLTYLPALINFFESASKYRFRWRNLLILFTTLLILIGWTLGIKWVVLFISVLIVSIAMRTGVIKKWKMLDAWRKLKSYTNVNRQLKQMAQGLLSAMQEAAVLPPRSSELELIVEEMEAGYLTCYLRNSGFFEENLFLEALQEMLDPIDNPRYLIAIQHDLMGEQDVWEYFPIPSVLARRRKEAELLLEHWPQDKRRLRLVYTRTAQGRMDLLKARGQQLGEEYESKRSSSWK